jgi:hypothetical protein
MFYTQDNTDVINAIFIEGQLLDRNVYRRLFDNYVATLPTNQIVSETLWTTAGNANKGFFTLGDGVTNFRLPLFSAAGYLKAVDGTTRVAGSYRQDQIKEGEARMKFNGQDSGIRNSNNGAGNGYKNAVSRNTATDPERFRFITGDDGATETDVKHFGSYLMINI